MSRRLDLRGVVFKGVPSTGSGPGSLGSLEGIPPGLGPCQYRKGFESAATQFLLAGDGQRRVRVD